MAAGAGSHGWRASWEKPPGVVGRVLREYRRTRPDMAEGCVEGFDLAFLWWVLRYPKRKIVVDRVLRRRVGRRIVVQNSRRSVERFLAGVAAESASAP